MIKILHIDDKRDISAGLNGLLEDHYDNAFLKWFDNFEDGIASLRNDPSMYNGIILDAKCFLNSNDGTLDEQYVVKAINDIETIFTENDLWMPYCVLSGFKEKLSGYFKTNNIIAFDKDDQELEALDYIISNQKKVDRHRFIEEFPGLLQFLNNGELEKYSSNNILQLYGAVKGKQKSPSIIKPQIALVRTILDNILKKLYLLGHYDGELLIPKEYVSSTGSRLQVNNVIGALIYLEGGEAKGYNSHYERSAVLPAYLSSQGKSIYNVTSDVGSHGNKDYGSIYTLSAIFYSLIDVLMWYKEFITNYKKEHTNG